LLFVGQSVRAKNVFLPRLLIVRRNVKLGYLFAGRVVQGEVLLARSKSRSNQKQRGKGEGRKCCGDARFASGLSEW